MYGIYIYIYLSFAQKFTPFTPRGIFRVFFFLEKMVREQFGGKRKRQSTKLLIVKALRRPQQLRPSRGEKKHGYIISLWDGGVLVGRLLFLRYNCGYVLFSKRSKKTKQKKQDSQKYIYIYQNHSILVFNGIFSAKHSTKSSTFTLNLP